MTTLLLAGACSGSSSPSAPVQTPRGTLDLVYFPDPAVGAPAPSQAPGFVTRVEMRIREVGGVGVTLRSIEASVSTDPASGVILDAPHIVAQAGSNRVEARGNLVILVEIAYQEEDGIGDVQVIIKGTDDLGNPVDYDGGLPLR